MKKEDKRGVRGSTPDLATKKLKGLFRDLYFL